MRDNKLKNILFPVGVGLTAVFIAACGSPESDSADGARSEQSSGSTQIIGTIGGGGALVGQPKKTAPKVGASAPDFESTTPDGKPINFVDFRGKPLVVNFWATWCTPCKKEMPDLQAVSEEYAARGLTILAVNFGDESVRDVTKYFNDLGLTFAAVLDPGQKISTRYGIFGLPTTFFIDKDGVIQYIKIGPFLTKEEIAKRLESII